LVKAFFNTTIVTAYLLRTMAEYGSEEAMTGH